MRGIIAIYKRNMTNFIRDKIRMVLTIFMSVFFLFIFSFAMKGSGFGVTQSLNYLISGIIIMTVFQSSLNNSTSILEDMSTGFMKEIIVSPVSRWQISIGQIMSATTIAAIQGLIVITVGIFMGLKIDVLQFVKMFSLMIVVGLTFSSIGLYLATLVRNSTSFQIMINILIMPLTFLSGAYIPTTMMPKMVQPLVFINPLTYTTAIFRFITLKMENLSIGELLKSGVAFDFNGLVIGPYMGLGIIVAMGLVFFTLCVMQFNKADFSQVKAFKHHKI
jgi:ABC-2 type transport system permease protein